MKKLDYRIMNADEYVRRSIIREMMFNHRRNLYRLTKDGSIGWRFFDKNKFDEKLKKQVKKKYGVRVDLKGYWDRFLKYSSLYMQLDFLQQTYGHTFTTFGKYKDYGGIIFYAKNITSNSDASTELLRVWFYNVIYKKYIEKMKWHYRFSFISKKSFELYIRWRPIADAAMYFDKTLTLEDIKKQIIMLAKKERLCIKSIDDYTIIFE